MMNLESIQKIYRSFARKEEIAAWKPFGHGHINDTYLIETVGADAPNYILQRKNHMIFKDVPGMMGNIILATNHIREQLAGLGVTDTDRRVMTYYQAEDGNYFTKDDEGNFWTLILFVRDCKTIEEVTNPEQAVQAGKAFGHFQHQLADLPGSKMIDTIPNFHNGKFRYWQFEQALAADPVGRAAGVKAEIEKLQSRAAAMTQLQEWLDNGSLPLRITHNDTKINNVLFDENDQILCVIDLDTVMPGTVLFDFGDAIRTLGNKAAEDEKDLSKVGFASEYYAAYARGYISESKKFLTPLEIENLAFSCRYMVWEQSCRFLTDWINGDTYYKIAYPEHNLVRSLSQIRYMEVLEENADFMHKVIMESL